MKTAIWLSLILGIFCVQPSALVASSDDSTAGDASDEKPAAKKKGKKSSDADAASKDSEAKDADAAPKDSEAKDAAPKKPDDVTDKCWDAMKSAAKDKTGKDCKDALASESMAGKAKKLLHMKDDHPKLKPVKELKKVCKAKKNKGFSAAVDALCPAPKAEAKSDDGDSSDKKDKKKDDDSGE